MKDKLSIIIPARNEEGNIRLTLEAIKEEVKMPYEIVVVDDSSVDRTAGVVNSYIKKNRNVSLVSTDQDKGGFSNAIRKGLEKSSGNILLIVMADLCDDPKTINRMYKKIVDGWDIVCGSRYIKGGVKKGGPVMQNFFSALVCKSLHYIIGIPTYDSSNAFKMFKRKVLKCVEYKADRGVEVSLDFILRAYFQGFSIVDEPTSWKGRTIGQSKFKLIERSPKYFNVYIWALMKWAEKLSL